MAESSFRSKHAGMPGSLMAIRVDYGRSTNAFDAPGAETDLGKTRTEVRRWAQGHRLGDTKDWNNSVRDDTRMRFPDRPNLRTLSEYQGTKLEYNYRAQTLPDVNKRTTFVPKASKLQADRSLFLTAEEKAKLVSKCPGTSTKLSRAEMQHEMPGMELEGGWNNSTALAEERTNVFKLRGYDDYRTLNKTKGLVDPNTYISPMSRQKNIMSTVRQSKIDSRRAEAAERERRGQKREEEEEQKAFTMRNIDEWWGQCPIPEVQARMPMQGTAVSAGSDKPDLTSPTEDPQ